MTGLNKAVIIHFGSKLPINCNIRNDNLDNFFSVELPDVVKLDISKGDPVVVGMTTEDGIAAIGGSIVSASIQGDYVKAMIILTNNREVATERRKAARIYTSLYGIISRNNMVVSDVCISDISATGLGIQSNTVFETGEQVEIDVLLREEVGKFKCSIVRKMKCYNKLEYGLTIIHDEESLPVTKQFIESICYYHKELMSILEQ